jgi:hypothetical protein
VLAAAIEAHDRLCFMVMHVIAVAYVARGFVDLSGGGDRPPM